MIFIAFFLHFGYIFVPRPYYIIYPKTLKNIFMNIDQDIEEMEGKILLLDNKRFVYCVSFIGIYYVAFIVFLTRMLLESGGFR